MDMFGLLVLLSMKDWKIRGGRNRYYTSAPAWRPSKYKEILRRNHYGHVYDVERPGLNNVFLAKEQEQTDPQGMDDGDRITTYTYRDHHYHQIQLKNNLLWLNVGLYYPDSFTRSQRKNTPMRSTYANKVQNIDRTKVEILKKVTLAKI